MVSVIPGTVPRTLHHGAPHPGPGLMHGRSRSGEPGAAGPGYRVCPSDIRIQYNVTFIDPSLRKGILVLRGQVSYSYLPVSNPIGGILWWLITGGNSLHSAVQ